MASLDDILTVQKNGVVAINTLNTKFTAALPTNTSATVVASTVQISTGKGVLLNVSIPATSGANQVLIYDASTVGSIASSNLIYASLPATAANFLSYTPVYLRYTNGLVVLSQAGMSAVVSYTPNV